MPVVQCALVPGTKPEHTPIFMVRARLMMFACIPSYQKSSVAVYLAHHLLSDQAAVSELGTTLSPSTMAEWNALHGEVDNALLKKKLASSNYKCHVVADDSNKHGEDRHMAGVHSWCDKNGGPAGYLLANTHVQSGSGANPAAVDEHVQRDIYSIVSVGGLVGDNSSTHTLTCRNTVLVLSRV